MNPDDQSTETVETPQGEEGSGGAPATPPETTEEPTTTEPISQADYDAALERMRAADRRAAANQQRADAAEAQANELRVRAAFERAALTGERRFVDVDAAWRLAEDHRAGLTVDDDGHVEGLDRVLGHIAERYPYLLADDPTPAASEPGYMPTPTTPKPSGQRHKDPGYDVKKLREKYPALRGQGPGRSALYRRR